MRFSMTSFVAGLAVMFAAGMAQAAPMPVAPLATGSVAPATSQAVTNGEGANLILVRGGCGFGEHRTVRGCHYNHGWRGRTRYRHNHWRYRRY